MEKIGIVLLKSGEEADSEECSLGLWIYCANNLLGVYFLPNGHDENGWLCLLWLGFC